MRQLSDDELTGGHFNGLGFIVDKKSVPKVELVKAKTFELDPSKRYLVVADIRSMTMQTAEDLVTAIDRLDIKSVVVVLKNNDTLQVVEMTPELEKEIVHENE